LFRRRGSYVSFACRDRAAGQIRFLSDTGEHRRQIEEELAWAKLCRAVNGSGKIFYRRRRVNIKRKSGNIADFLRRWSKHYDYMIVLDADSLMTGAAVVRLTRFMEASPQVGIIQTVPTIVNGDSLFARMQQFASRVYGRRNDSGAWRVWPPASPWKLFYPRCWRRCACGSTASLFC
jgi:membrane glycosyltransferase